MSLKLTLEALLMASNEPLTLERLQLVFDEFERPSLDLLRSVLLEIKEDYAHRVIELVQVASGYRFQIRVEYAQKVAKLWDEKPGRYSRAFLETLALIAYRQPITRSEIEDIRGVSVNSAIIKTLLEREWIRVVGYKEVPGKPALFGTTKAFLDYFNLKALGELPTLAEFQEQTLLQEAKQEPAELIAEAL